MSLVWRDEPDIVLPRPGPRGRVRAAARAALMGAVLLAGVASMALLRLVERPLCHPRRPWTPAIPVAVCRACLRILGLRVTREGRPLAGPGAFVANHSSWLDILVLNAQAPMVFVSKSEIAGWPGVGFLARITGTVFVRREARSEAAAQAAALGERLRAGQRLLFFPEGTSTDGRRVLPFKSALFAGLLAPGLPPGVAVQPVTLAWRAPPGEDPRFYGWWGGASFGPSALAVLASARPGGVHVVLHPPIPIGGAPDRKTLARGAEEAVRRGLEAAGLRP